MPATPAHRVRALTAAAMAGAGRAVQPAASPTEADASSARRRWALTPRAAVAAGVVLLAVAGVAVGRSALARSAPEPVPVPVATVELAEEVPDVSVEARTPEAAGGPGGVGGAGEEVADGSGGSVLAGSSVGAGGSASAVVVVHVAGQVGRPGVVEVPSGSRLQDAIEAAGGATGEADLAAVNLARPVVDGEQVYVPSTADERAPASWGGSAAGAGGAVGAGSGIVDLNAADVGALDALPGIGPVLAQRILDWRTEHGRFTSVDELGEVAGIGPTVLERLRPLVVV